MCEREREGEQEGSSCHFGEEVEVSSLGGPGS